jgi:CheY-like chemotaxis protein
MDRVVEELDEADLILMDINLPGMSGIDALKVLQEVPELAAIPVVAISAAAMPSDIERAQNAGYKWYVTKPINLPDILRVMREALAIEPEVSA